MRFSSHIQPSQIWSAITGLAFGIFPQAGVAALVPAGLIAVIREKRVHDRLLEGLLIAWAVVRGVQSWRANGQAWMGLLEVALMWLLFRGLVALSTHRRIFGVGAAIGLTVAMMAAFLPAWSLVPFSLGFMDLPNVARLERNGSSWNFSPVQQGNAWVYVLSTTQGSGRIAFEIPIRASQDFKIGTFINEYRFADGSTQRLLNSCSVTPVWTRCRVEVQLADRAVVTLGIGGNETWKAGSVPIELREARVIVIDQPSLLERFQVSNRSSGWSFNENGLGAWAAIAALFIAVTCCDWRWTGLGVTAGLLGVFLSGSRGALLALVLGLLVLGLGRVWIRQPRFLPWSIVVLAVVFVGGFVSTLRTEAALPSGFRAFDPNQSFSVSSRLDVYRTAMRIILESPIFGVGDLQSAITDRLHSVKQAQSSAIHAHNLALQVLGESGILGFVIMFALWTVIVRRAWITHDFNALALLVAVLVVSTVDYLFLYSPAQIAFWFAAAQYSRQKSSFKRVAQVSDAYSSFDHD